MMLLGLALIVLIIIVILIVAAASGGSQSGQEDKQNMSLKKAYLYLVSVISLVIWVVGAIMLINMALKTWVFPKADRYSYYAPCESVVTPDGKSTGCDPVTEERQRKMDEENRSSQKQRDAAQAISMIIVAAPVWYFHWRLARKEV